VVVMATRARVNGRSSLAVPLLVLTAAAAAAGAIVFALVAASGALFPVASRGLLAGSAALVLLAVASRRERPWQRDVETATRWLEREGLLVAVWNGLALGAGFVTRVGFWLWWLLPLLVFESGSIAIGAAAGSLYGATRLGVSGLVAAGAEAWRSDRLPRRLLAWRLPSAAVGEALFFAASGTTLAVAARLVGFEWWG
jgi:hypothetical protein